jgi:putative addiction module antidote
MTTAKIRKIGNSLGVVLPKDVLEMLGAREGDIVSFARSAEGLLVTVSDEENERLRTLADEIMERRYAVLRALAK